ncbi:acetate--CoA ligase family protein [Arvimicrobium flavum]|uniref:acetate--CoA ligase family protein n=1 Tax=Arvimicrobium flavum TaxID=3393320 RepID=UPI00237B0DB8|nr:acetate--CoA ligase family protein [Mesorhizobium shangrilense]
MDINKTHAADIASNERAACAADNMARLLSPRSIAMVGASNNMVGIGGRVFANLSRAFKGPLYPINPRDPEIQGHKAYKQVGDLPEVPDMVVIAVAAEHAVGAFEACAEAGIGGAVILTSGFAEAGDEGKEMQAEISRIIARTGIRAIGPNCIGYLNVAGGVMANFALSPTEPIPDFGRVALVSQSGGFGSYLVTKALVAGLGVGWYVSTGNEVDVNVTGALRYLVDRDDVGVLLAFCETLRDPDVFVETARRAAELDKPMILLKAGRSEEAARAAVSHTASVVGSAEVFDAVCRQYGVIVAETMEEMLDLALMFQDGRRLKNGRTVIMTSSGGAGVLLADEGARAGLSIPELPAEEQELIASKMPQPFFGSAANPIDTTAQISARPTALAEVLDILRTSPSIDVVTGVVWAQATSQVETFIHVHRNTDKVCAVLSNGHSDLLNQAKVPYYTDPRRLMHAVGTLHRYSTRPALSQTDFSVDTARQERVRKLLADVPQGENALMEHQGKRILAEYGVHVTREEFVSTPQQAAAAAERIGGKVVIKAMSYDIPHKSEMGAVRLGLHGGAEVGQATSEMLSEVSAKAPDATVAGVLVQEMVPARFELSCGMQRDPIFGPMVAITLGGILIEILAEATLLRAPFDRATAMEAIGRLCEGRLMGGTRGLTASEAAQVADIAVGLGQLAMEQPTIVEVDVNPVRVDKGAAIAADALIVLGETDNG